MKLFSADFKSGRTTITVVMKNSLLDLRFCICIYGPILLLLSIAIIQGHLINTTITTTTTATATAITMTNCNIPRVAGSQLLSFNQHGDFPTSPMIFDSTLPSSSRTLLQSMCSKDNLIQNYAHEDVKVSSSNTYSSGLYTMQLGEYIDHLISKNANE